MVVSQHVLPSGATNNSISERNPRETHTIKSPIYANDIEREEGK